MTPAVTESTTLLPVVGGTANGTAENAKSIGYLGSIAIAVNSLAGPAVLQLPFQYQESGLIPTTICLIAVGALSAYCSLHTANTVSMVPNNRNFTKRVEFSDPYLLFWNKTAYQLTQVLFFLCATCLNVAAIIDTAEVVDSSLGTRAKSYAWAVDHMEIQEWHVPGGSCTRQEVKLGVCDPFSDEDVYGNYLLTLGYAITASVFLPLCLKDLKENTNWQIFGFGVLVTLSGYFCWSFWESGKLTLRHASLMGTPSGLSNMLGVIMFNFALVLAVPAWVHEKKETVSVSATIVQATVIATLLYVGVGALGALAISKVNVNMLKPMVSGAYGEGVQVASSVFAFFIIGLDIPLFCVLTRYNLTHSGLCSVRTANILVVWIPWGLSWVFYQGGAIGSLLDWGGTLFTSAVAFILPLYLSLRAVLSTIPGTHERGSVSIVGTTSRRAHIISLYVLLFVAGASVLVAIVGQLVVKEEKKAFLHSDVYASNEDDLIE